MSGSISFSRLVLGLLLWLSAGALACPFEELAGYYGDPVPASRPLEGIASPTSEAVAESGARLEGRLRACRGWFGCSLIGRLREQAPAIDGIFENVARSGVQNRGVFAVETPLGRKVLKVSDRYTGFDLRYAVAVQQTLAELELAPRIHGIYEGRRLERLLGDLDAERFLGPDYQGLSGSGRSGILMDEVPEGYNFLRPKEPVPEFLAHLDREAVVIQIRQMESVLNRLGVIARDPQFLVTPDSRVWLIDLDLYLIRDARGVLRGLGHPPANHRPLPTRNDFNQYCDYFNRLYLDNLNPRRSSRWEAAVPPEPESSY